MKLKYFLKEKLNLSNGYIIAIAVLILIVIIGGSYALFTTSSESKGALNIVTGDLKPSMTSDQLDEDNDVVVEPNQVKTVIISLKNVNPVEAKYNLFYSTSKENANIEIGYLTTGDDAPTTLGYTIPKTGSSDDTKTIKVRILNNEKENITVTFGSNVGLAKSNLDFPAGKQALTKIDSNVIQAYNYQEDKTATNYCINGEEETCEKTTCLEDSDANSCTQGTIVRYAVSDTENHYFYVLHDDGATLTLQQRENTVKNVPWISKEDYIAAGGTEAEYGTNGNNTKGPITAITKLEEATKTWSNVNDMTYQMGTTNFNGTNAFTGCTTDSNYKATCSVNTYNSDANALTFPKRTAKARMITAQEASSTSCLQWKDNSKDSTIMGSSIDSNNHGSCPDFMHNYLYHSKTYGGSYEDNTVNENGDDNESYWTMSVISSNFFASFIVHRGGNINASYISTTATNGARAVIQINKNS